MTKPLPRRRVPRSPATWIGPLEPATLDWEGVPSLEPFVVADGSGPARQQTVVRVCQDERALYLRFDCEDRDIWGTYSRRDEPIYEQEAVELFLAPGEEDPVDYYELEVSPLGALFDARIHNPTSRRDDLVVDVGWDCPGIRWAAGIRKELRHWWAALIVPWSALVPSGPPPAVFRANFYRIERPRDGAAEFSCWSPTFTDPADFHKPAFFGVLELGPDRGLAGPPR